jgi:ATP adenylyltransferase/5',5'''-P-1,P-4-tetraphosphate phosphorylase II
MLQEKTISSHELKRYGSVENPSESAKTLVKQQTDTWPLAQKNYRNLETVESGSFDFGTFSVLVQHNPGRIRSSAARTDARTLAERPCFLCLENLPPEQKGLFFLEKYLILTNPFPVFPVHLTLSDIHHTPQRIQPRISDLLEAAKKLREFTIFYNGPGCGASAPNHFHFQAVEKGSLPVEKEWTRNSEKIPWSEKTILGISKNYLRRFMVIESTDPEEVKKGFKRIYSELEKHNQKPEPMLNMLCSYSNHSLQLIIFPREKQRPSHFFRKGKERIIIGPASVEMGGVIILPRKEDFDKITEKEITEIYEEVTLEEKRYSDLIKTIVSKSL